MSCLEERVVAASWTRKKVILNNGKSMHKGVRKGKYCYCTYRFSEMNDVFWGVKLRGTLKEFKQGNTVKNRCVINPTHDIVKNKLEDR